MIETPLVSVVIAAYNMGQYIREAIDSVLAQDWPAVEVVLVDDGSTDETACALDAYADEPRVTVIRQANAGQTKAKNAGLRVARGEYVGFCDADNVWLPGKLRRQVPLLQANPGAGVVYGDVALIGPAGESLPAPRVKRWGGRISGRLLADNFVTFNTTLTPRRVLEEFGGFDESLRMAIDYDLWLRVSTKYEFLYVRETLVQYRIWGGQMSHRTGERLDSYFRLLERFLERYPDSVSQADVAGAYAHTYITRGIWRAREGDRAAAWRDLLLACRRRPIDIRLWRVAASLALGRLGPRGRT
jgi:glycosyltransferase involved in cell wall biosynthesis